MTVRILIGMYLLFTSMIIASEPRGATAAPPAMQYPGQSCDRWEQKCTKLHGQTERWYECMTQPEAMYYCQDPAGYAGYPPPETPDCDMWRQQCAANWGTGRMFDVCMQRRAAVVACGRY